jgi:hypothetical protein
MKWFPFIAGLMPEVCALFFRKFQSMASAALPCSAFFNLPARRICPLPYGFFERAVQTAVSRAGWLY